MEMKKKNNFKSKVNPGKGRQMLVRESLPQCNKCEKSHGFKPSSLAKTFVIGVGNQDTIPKIATLKSQ